MNAKLNAMAFSKRGTECTMSEDPRGSNVSLPFDLRNYKEVVERNESKNFFYGFE